MTGKCPFQIGELVVYEPTARGRGLSVNTDLANLVPGRIYRIAAVQRDVYVVVAGFDTSAGGGLYWTEFRTLRPGEQDDQRSVSRKLVDLFYAGERSNEVPFVVNDSVEVIAGRFRGRRGAVISLEEASPRIRYVVEFADDGSSTEIEANGLRLMDA